MSAPSRSAQPPVDGGGNGILPQPPTFPGTAPAAKVSPLTPPATQRASLPSVVFAAYRSAQASLAGSDPGCHLSWQLLAAIGQVESDQADGGNVDSEGTALTPILGPLLDGNGVAAIRDTDHGLYDGSTTWDRAVGPMQFIPSTWAIWGADARGTGHPDPENIRDASLAAGRYLCAGGRDLSVAAQLDQAILGYNDSADYLRTVKTWMAYFASGTPVLTDTLPAPAKPSAAPTPAPSTASHAPTPAPTSPPSTPSTPRPTTAPTASGSPTSSPSPATTASPGTSPTSSPTPTPTGCPSPTPGASATGTPTATTSPAATAGPSPTATPAGSPSATPTPQSPGTPTPTPTPPGCAAPSR
ncbi:lytic transglycosylase domain-containing protein [Streptacidiphilus sp. EB129]|uniref:lytic transglycosylase domain-containing protein n=1 Tax=Streptacidiphilus sp. EB129 TaxID=3156262 RepID=UPI00351237C9